jgi:hypothetical protein
MFFSFIHQNFLSHLALMACNKVDTANSTEVALGSDEVFTGSWVEITDFATISVIYESDVEGANNALRMQFSIDGSTVLREKLITPQLQQDGSGNYGGVHMLATVAKWFRVVYTNGSSAQSSFQLQTILSQVRNKHLTSSLNQIITDSDDVELTRGVIMGKTTGGAYLNVGVDPEGGLKIDTPRSAFGEQEVTNPTPIVQVDFIYNINTDMIDTNLTGTGSVTQANAMAVVATGASASSSAELLTKRYIKYRPGQGCHIRGTALFTSGVAGSIQLFGAGDSVDGLFFGYNGTSFGILHRNDSVNTWIPQASWNGDLMDGSGDGANPSGQTLDPTKGNVFEIQFQWLGFGAIRYAVEDAVTGNFITVHTIEYANNYTKPSLGNPSFPICWFVENTSNTSDVVVKGASCAGEVEGEIRYLGPTNSISNTKTGVGTSFTNIITIRNKSTFVSQTNRTPINILKYGVAVDGTKNCVFELIKNTTLGGTPSYTDISTNTSVIEYDTAGTTITGGSIIDDAVLTKNGSLKESPKVFDIFLDPGDTLTLAVRTTGGSTEASCSVRWVEDF